MPKKELVFIIQAHEGQMPDSSLTDVATLELFAENASEALKRAKKIIEKKFYRIRSVIEK